MLGGNVRTINVRTESNSTINQLINPKSVKLVTWHHRKKLSDAQNVIEVYKMVPTSRDLLFPRFEKMIVSKNAIFVM